MPPLRSRQRKVAQSLSRFVRHELRLSRGVGSLVASVVEDRRDRVFDEFAFIDEILRSLRREFESLRRLSAAAVDEAAAWPEGPDAKPFPALTFEDSGIEEDDAIEEVQLE